MTPFPFHSKDFTFNMTQTELKNTLQLLHSNDPQNAILAINILWGFEDIPKPLELALGLVCYLERDEGVVAEAIAFLTERLGKQGLSTLTKRLLVLVKAHKNRHALLRQPQYAVLSDDEMLEAFCEQHSDYAPIVLLHPFYLSLYLKAGIYWNYEAKITSPKSNVFFEDVLQFDSKHPYALFGMAYHYEKQQNQAQKAIESYRKFLLFHPDLEVDEQMMEDYQVQVYLDLPTSFKAYLRIAQIYKDSLQDYEQAIAYYYKAQKSAPEHVGFQFRDFAELIWFHKDNSGLAMQLIEEGLALLERKDLPKAHLFSISPLAFSVKKAHLQILAGDIEAEENQAFGLALKYYKQALHINPTLMEVRLKQIRIVFEHFKDYWQVESLCLQALKFKNPKQKPFHFEAKRYLKMARQKRKHT